MGFYGIYYALVIYCLVVEPNPLKNMSSSIGMISDPIDGKIKFMFQTANQRWHARSFHTGSQQYTKYV